MFSVERQEPGLKGWHEGELKLQKLTGHAHEVRHDHEIVRSYLPESQVSHLFLSLSRLTTTLNNFLTILHYF